MTFPLFDLAGQRALITGSSQGIGFALAQGLGAHGATLVINGRNSERVEEAVSRLLAVGVEASAAVFDVTDQKAVATGVEKVEQTLGPIDILISNAGMQHRAPLEDFPPEKFDEMLRTNVASVFYVGQAVARFMIARGRGKIINVASVQAELARPGIAPYTATKGAVRNLTRGMSADWARHGLQVNALAPGYFRTPLNKTLIEDPKFTAWLEGRTPAGRWGNVEELVGAAVFLASMASSFVSGQMIVVDGGLTTSL
ncbi:SDR family oxidoreductase [Mesorhizobium sp. NBSH29]|uniref:SDR family oxidoreductase n=1 Tax=Mesorhizobium sp. NBSH29 TaxID=2654249 RepID=UPI0018964BCB|nr:SDR family oxidoreductase [Mesorhizobium sp. NBSH29]QPC85581.1 SDR family oxidoreductase [Mesorhizobium sp. NBSH29]